ncbi:MAG: MFS transporter [Rubrivivax sp.]
MAADSRSSDDPTPRRLMPALFIGVFMAALDTAVIAPAIPALREAFHIDHRDAGLLMVVFVLCSLCSTALLANLGDRHGRRPVYLFSVSMFALGSLLIALSPSFAMVLAGRAVQGLGAGGIIPTASAVIGDAVAPKERGRALGLIGATYGMAFVLGPPLATLLMMASSWHWIFLLNLPIAAVVLVMAARSVPHRAAARAHAPLDRLGIVLVFLFLGCLVLGITRIADVHFAWTLWPGFLATAAVALVLLMRVERRAAAPMIPLSLLRNRQLAITYALTVGAGFGMGSVIFLSSIAHLAHGVAPRHAGFVLLPLVLSSMIGSMGAGRLLNRLGARALMLVGFGMLALGYAASAITAAGLWFFLLASIPVGVGVGIVVGGALRSIAIDEAPAAQRGAAQGLINICTSVGTLLSAAAVSAVADFSGGGARGFAVAYVGVAGLMLLMLLATLSLRSQGAAHLPAERVA